MWLLIGVMPSVLFPILFPFFVLWCELHGLYLALWISMVAWLNPITENNICSLGNNRNQNDPLFLKHDFWLMKTKMQFWLLIFTVFLLSPMRLHPVTSGDVNASSPEVARSQFRWNIKRCSYSCSDIGSLNMLSLISVVAVLCSAYSHTWCIGFRRTQREILGNTKLMFFFVFFYCT